MAEVTRSFFTYLPTAIGLGLLLYVVLRVTLGPARANRVLVRSTRFLGGGLVRLVAYVGRVFVLTLINTGVLLARLVVGWGRPSIVTYAWGRYWEGMAEVFLGRR